MPKDIYSMSFGSSANEPFLHQFYCHAKMCCARTWYLEHNRIIPRHALYVDLHRGRPCYPVKVSVGRSTGSGKFIQTLGFSWIERRKQNVRHSILFALLRDEVLFWGGLPHRNWASVKKAIVTLAAVVSKYSIFDHTCIIKINTPAGVG